MGPVREERIFVGNALDREPGRRFTYVRTGLDYVAQPRRRELVEHLLAHADRLIVGVFNEHVTERTTEEALLAWGFSIDGQTTRRHRGKPGMEYRVLWIDAERG